MGKNKNGVAVLLYYSEYNSPAGMLLLTSDADHLIAVDFQVDDRPFAPSDEVPDVLVQTRRWLDRYFRGERPDPGTLPMKLEGTPFQKLIWQRLLQIPYGGTKTYGDIAKEAAGILGRGKMSAQAVGQAVGRNPIAIIVPCHRVLGAGGKLTGYSYGLSYKIWLLNHEQKQNSEEM